MTTRRTWAAIGLFLVGAAFRLTMAGPMVFAQPAHDRPAVGINGPESGGGNSAPSVTALAKARAAWQAALAEADPALLEKHTPAESADARRLAADAEARIAAAAASFNDAAKALRDATAVAKTIENGPKAAPIFTKLDAATDRFVAEGLLAQLEVLVPREPRLPGLRERVKAMAWPHDIVVELGEEVAVKLVLIPAGKFTMGSPANEQDRRKPEGPQHEVTIAQPFYVGVYPVTQQQFERVLARNPSSFKGPKCPVDSANWDDATQFCRTLSAKLSRTFRLPTEAEWEYACRAGSSSRYCFGDDEDELSNYAWTASNSGGQTHPVGQKKPNAWGLYDVHGNVWEWCGDWYAADYFERSARVDPVGPASGSCRVVRGGSWDSYQKNCRSALRHFLSPGDRTNVAGFRVVLEAK